MSYTQFGPFVDGGSPGVSAEFLNPLETFLLSLNSASYDSHITANGSGIMTLLGLIANGAMQPNPSVTTTNGNTAGTVKVWQPFTGTFKLVGLFFNGFRNAGANQNLVLPAAFTTFAFFYIGSICNPINATNSGLQFLLSGSAQNCNLYNGGNVAPSFGATIRCLQVGTVLAGFDTVSVLGTSNLTGNATDSVIIAGV